MVEQEIHMKDGIWTILKKGDEICIVDPQGRCRHMSKGHNTAMHLAMQLGDRAFYIRKGYRLILNCHFGREKAKTSIITTSL